MSYTFSWKNIEALHENMCIWHGLKQIFFLGIFVYKFFIQLFLHNSCAEFESVWYILYLVTFTFHFLREGTHEYGDDLIRFSAFHW